MLSIGQVDADVTPECRAQGTVGVDAFRPLPLEKGVHVGFKLAQQADQQHRPINRVSDFGRKRGGRVTEVARKLIAIHVHIEANPDDYEWALCGGLPGLAQESSHLAVAD